MSVERTTPRAPMLNGLRLIAASVALMWVVEIVDLAAGDLDGYGIRPRDADGLVGILAAPFLHGGFAHLVGNTLPFLVLGGLVALGGLLRVAAVSAIVIVASGVGVWLTADSGSLHIGASGLVFGYAAYLIARGAITRDLIHVAVALVVIVVYGTTLLFGLLPGLGISWQGHLFGAAGGALAARWLDRRSSLGHREGNGSRAMASRR